MEQESSLFFLTCDLLNYYDLHWQEEESFLFLHLEWHGEKYHKTILLFNTPDSGGGEKTIFEGQ